MFLILVTVLRILMFLFTFQFTYTRGGKLLWKHLCVEFLTAGGIYHIIISFLKCE